MLEELLEDREDVERVRRERGSFDDSVRDLPERRAELGAKETDLARQLRDLGQGWDESRVDDFDTSVVFREEVDGFRKRLSDQAARVRSTAEQLERERAELADRQSAVEQAQARVPEEQPALDSAEIELRRSALRTSRSRLNDHDRAGLRIWRTCGCNSSALTGDGPSAGYGAGTFLVAASRAVGSRGHRVGAGRCVSGPGVAALGSCSRGSHADCCRVRSHA